MLQVPLGVVSAPAIGSNVELKGVDLCHSSHEGSNVELCVGVDLLAGASNRSKVTGNQRLDLINFFLF